MHYSKKQLNHEFTISLHTSRICLKTCASSLAGYQIKSRKLAECGVLGNRQQCSESVITWIATHMLTARRPSAVEALCRARSEGVTSRPKVAYNFCSQTSGHTEGSFQRHGASFQCRRSCPLKFCFAQGLSFPLRAAIYHCCKQQSSS